VKKLSSLYIPVMACLFSAGALAQRPTYPAAPAPMNSGTSTSAVPVHVLPRADLLQLQKEADDLARTAQSIPADLESVRKGMLPKDVIQKLKEIEKLSKRLRSELNP
jgi:hypothetical protein